MTVIAVFENYQIAISDSLLTVDDKTAFTDTPTTGSTALIPNLNLGVSRLVRKLVKAEGPCGCAELLAAGTVRDINCFATELKNIFKNPKSLPKNLAAIVKEKGAPGCVEVAALITNQAGHSEFEVLGVAGNRICSHTFDATQIAVEFKYFGTVRIAGSGASDLLNWLEERDKTFATHYSKLDFNNRRFQIANTIPLLLMEEDFAPSHKTIKSGVGGFYETYEIKKNHLVPIASCLSIIADLVGKPRDRTVLIRRLIYHCYNGEDLYVFSLKHDIKVSSAHPGKIPLTECTLFKIPALNSEPNNSKWKIDRLAIQLSAETKIRMSIRKEINTDTSVRRFNTNDPSYPKLLKISISGENLILEPDENGFDFFTNRFSEPPIGPILILN